MLGETTGAKLVGDYTVQLNQSGQQTIPALIQALEQHDLRVILTFDLQHARTPHPNCTCPHHGTQACNCQYAVLLVYAPPPDHEAYYTVTIHGRDDQVWLSLSSNTSSPKQITPVHEALEMSLLAALYNLIIPPPIVNE